MGKISESIGSVIGFLIGAAFFGIWGLGIYHGIKKHDESINFESFYWSFYRGVEFFWHDDFAGVDWDKRLANDVKSCIFYMSKSGDDKYDNYKYNQVIEEYSKIITLYPEDKKEYLKSACKEYYNFSISFLGDIKLYALNKDTSSFKFSEKTIKIKDKFYKYISKEDLDAMESDLKMFDKLKDFKNMGNFDDEIEISDKFDNSSKKVIGNLKTAYKNLFNVELN